MKESDKSRRDRIGVVPLHVDIYPTDRDWMNKQRKPRGLTWRGYFQQLRTELMGLYKQNRDQELEILDLRKEIQMLETKKQ